MENIRQNLISLLGIAALLAIAWLLSSNRRRVNWRVLGWGLGLQLALAALIFLVPGSPRVFLWLNAAVKAVLDASVAGQKFVFNDLGDPAGSPVGFVLAFQALPLIIFFAALMQLLYYFGVIQLVIRGFAWVFTRLMRISGAESLCAASNIFVGVESAATIRPYLGKMTRSEFCTVLTAGMATVASTVLLVYVSFFEGTIFADTIAGHLISASIMSAPAAIVMSKLLVPEEGMPLTLGRSVKLEYERESNAIESIINGAMAGVKLLVGVVALLIAFLGLLALVNLALGAAGGPVNHWTGWTFDWSLQNLLGWALTPLAWLMGVPWAEAHSIGQLLGERLVVTELVAYKDLAKLVLAGKLSDRSVVVASYALCGFAHVASLAIFVGGYAALVPDRRKDLAAVGPRALLAATLACLLTGAVAGLFYSGPAILGTP